MAKGMPALHQLLGLAAHLRPVLQFFATGVHVGAHHHPAHLVALVPFGGLQHCQAEAGSVQLGGLGLEAEGLTVHRVGRARHSRSPLALDKLVVVHQGHFDKHT